MTIAAFDTLEFVEELIAAGVPEPQAKAQARAIAKAASEGLASKHDLEDLRRDMKEMELRIIAEIAPLRWGMAVSVGGIVALMIKLFVPLH